MSSSRQNINKKLDVSINNNKEGIKIENENNIKFIRRTIENNTHEVFEDIKLKSITSWRKSKTKFLKNLIYNILTFGILHIISLFKPNLYLKLYCYPWPAKECDFFLVENIYGELTLCTKIHKKAKNNNNINFSADLSKDNIVSSSIINHSNKFDNYLIKNLTYSFKYKSVTYEYKEDTNEIVPVYMNISKMTNRGIFNYFSEGLSSEKMVNKFLERYGKNEYNIYLGIIYFYFLRIELPYLIIVILIGLIEFCLKDYVSIISKYIIVSLILYIEYQITKRVVYNSYTKEYTLDGEKYKLKVKRKHKLIQDSNSYYEIKNCDLLPGDIIFLKENDLVPCDCLILEGECIVNESNSTGSLDIFKKTSLENNNELFSYEMNKISILYHGMKIIKTFSKSNNGYISVLCINTGPNTYKANQYSNALYLLERKKEYREMYELFGEKRKNMLIAIIIIFFLSIIFAIIYYITLDPEPLDFNDPNTKKLLFEITVRFFCKSFMPGYFLTNSIILILGVYHLKKENIHCFEKSKLLSSSTIDTIFFSKTGTLCENNFEINGYHPIYINPHKSNNISYRTYKFSQYKEMNSQLLQYYKNYLYRVQNNSSNYEFNLRHGLKFEHNRLTLDKINKESYQYTTLFLECLLTCNNIEKFNNEVFGNSIETEIFKNMRWDMKAYNNNNITKNIESNQDISKNKSVNKKEFKGSKIGYLDRSKNDIYPNNYYKITESVKNENGFHPQPIKTRLNSKYYLEQSKKLNNSICSEATLIKNFIRNDISHSHINSYKLRIYKRFIKNGTLNSSAIVYNFITKELRFMTKGNPEDILDKCDPGTIPDNFDKIVSIFRRSGFIIIICASKIISIDDYNDSNSSEEYMNDLTFCGFVTLKNKLKKEVLNAIKDLRQFSCNLIITTGDNVFNSLSVGFDSHIIDNKNIFSFDKEDKKNGIIIEKIYSIKRLIEEDKNTNSSLDMHSRLTTGISNKFFTSPFTKPKDSVMIKYLDPNKEKAVTAIENELSLNEGSNKIITEYKNLTPNKTLKRGSLRKKKRNAKYLNIYDENMKFQKRSRLYSEISDIKDNQLKKDTTDNSRVSNINPLNYKDRNPYKISKKNKSINENKENQDSNANTNKKFKNSSEARSKNLSNLEKFYYYPGIFEDNEELNDNCIYCISGKLFNFLYKNKEKKQCKYILERIHKHCKIFYQMSSIDKSLVIDFYREYPDSCICKIGECLSDIDAILSSNVGINLKSPSNENTMLCHFYTEDASILSIKKIIREGRAIKENIILLKISSIFYTFMINSYIICCFIRHTDVIINQLNFLEISFLIVSISAFTGETDNNKKSNQLIRNKKLYVGHYITQIGGLFFFKVVSIYFHGRNFIGNKELNPKIVDKIYCSFYFILCIEQLFSTVFVLNLISFYRKDSISNLFYNFSNILLLIYFIILNILTSSNYKCDFLNITVFDYNENIVDTHGDNNRIKCFFVCIIDFSVTIIYSRVVYYVFDRLAKD